MKKIVFAFIVMFLAASCTNSKSPIRSVNGPDYDDRLSGVWTGGNDSERFYVHIGKENGKGVAVYVEHKKNNDMTIERYPFISAGLENGCCMSVMPKDGEDDGYVLIRYALDKSGQLSFTHINDQYMKEAISAGRLNGTIKDGEHKGDELRFSYQNIYITAPEDELRNFVIQNSEKMFSGEPALLDRVK
jgi:hypothetical protein